MKLAYKAHYNAYQREYQRRRRKECKERRQRKERLDVILENLRVIAGRYGQLTIKKLLNAR
jgi:hypothetical protein